MRKKADLNGSAFFVSMRSQVYQPFFCFACQAASTAASRSTEIPERSFACLSAGCFLNHSSVACAVSLTGRHVNPLLRAFFTLICEKPVSPPRGDTHMSDHGQMRYSRYQTQADTAAGHRGQFQKGSPVRCHV